MTGKNQKPSSKILIQVRDPQAQLTTLKTKSFSYKASSTGCSPSLATQKRVDSLYKSMSPPFLTKENCNGSSLSL